MVNKKMSPEEFKFRLQCESGESLLLEQYYRNSNKSKQQLKSELNKSLDKFLGKKKYNKK